MKDRRASGWRDAANKQNAYWIVHSGRKFDHLHQFLFCNQRRLPLYSQPLNMTPRFQKFVLLAHITFSVGWFGAVVPYLALAIAGLTSHDLQMARAAYLSMELIGWYVIVPFSVAALLSGLVQSLGTQWGLFRHRWILVKFLLTIFAVAVLLRHMQEVSRVSRMAKETMLSGGEFRPELIHSAGGLVVLFAAMTLSVFKPWGMTSYGRRRAESRASSPSRPSDQAKPVREPVFVASRPRWGRIIGIHAVALVLLFAIMHITGLHHH